MAQQGVLLINLGTPDSCASTAVYRYLTEFLNDPRVIDIPFLARWILVNLIIIPLRFRTTTHAYSQIWEANGSPLLIHSQELCQAVRNKLGEDYHVELAMRYGKPNIAEAIIKLRHCKQITVIPMFPQYSSAATGSAVAKTLELLALQWNIPELKIIRDFYNYPGFIKAYAALIREQLTDKSVDMLLFSYHGLPDRHITKSNCVAVCDHNTACPKISRDSQFCYRAQCYETSRLIAAELNLKSEEYTSSFQSRLGKTPWIKPYTDLLLPELISQGIKNIAIVCPSFVADCLETLEEINIRARKQWQELGGNEFIFIPCLNAQPLWVNAVTDLVLYSSEGHC